MDEIISGSVSHVRFLRNSTDLNPNPNNSNVRIGASLPKIVDVQDPEQTLNYDPDEQSQSKSQSTHVEGSSGNVAQNPEDDLFQDRISRLELMMVKLCKIYGLPVDDEPKEKNPLDGGYDPITEFYETAQPGYVSSDRVRINSLPRSPSASPNVDENQFVKDSGAINLSTRLEDHRLRNVAPQQLVPINQVNPPIFNGDKTEARAWLKEYDNTMEMNGFGNTDKMKRAFAYTSGPARSWYNVTMNLKPNLDWPAFKKEFILHFCGADGQVHLRRRLDETTQKGDEHPTDYVMRTLDLCLQYNSNMSEKEKIDRLAHGLRLDIYNHLIVVKPDMTEWKLEWLLACLATFRTKDDTKRSAETFQRSNGSPSNKSKSPSTLKATTPPEPEDLSTWHYNNCEAEDHVLEDCNHPRIEDKISASRANHREQKLEQRVAYSISRVCKQEPDLSRLPCDNLPKPMLKVGINGKNVLGRIDTGADMTIIPSNVAEDLNLTVLDWNQPSFMAANNSSIEFSGMSPTLITLNGSHKTLLVAVASKGTFKQTLFGNDLLCLFNVQLNFGTKDCELSPGPVNVHRAISKTVAPEQPKHVSDRPRLGRFDPQPSNKFTVAVHKNEHVFNLNPEPHCVLFMENTKPIHGHHANNTLIARAINYSSPLFHKRKRSGRSRDFGRATLARRNLVFADRGDLSSKKGGGVAMSHTFKYPAGAD